MNAVLGQFSSPPTHGKAAGKARRPGFVLNWLDCIKLMLTVATNLHSVALSYHLLCVLGIATLEASSIPEVKPRITCIVWNATDLDYGGTSW